MGSQQSRLLQNRQKSTGSAANTTTTTNTNEDTDYKSFESLSLQHRQKLWPYIASIRYPKILDWRRHFLLPKNQNSKEEERDIKLQNQIKIQADLPVKISDGLYLSDAVGASNIKQLKHLGITHVLNVGGKEAAVISNDNVYEKEGITRLTINEAKDEHGYPMLHYHLTEALGFAETSKKGGGKCLIHCAQGINRSGVLVAAITMLTEREHVLNVVLHCRTQRGNVFMFSNQSFQEDLVLLAEKEGLLGPKLGSDSHQEGCLGISGSEIPPFHRYAEFSVGKIESM
mmetsp:Transcript_2821/g.3870  ORF Transcript_2821/g.3870 Transcript_2821/m.3870 type:complete len:286 (+) Transcript_2821:65-922(+)